MAALTTACVMSMACDADSFRGSVQNQRHRNISYLNSYGLFVAPLAFFYTAIVMAIVLIQ